MKNEKRILFLSSLFELHRIPHEATVFHVAPRTRNGRLQVSSALLDHRPHKALRGGWWAVPREMVGESLRQYHPLYVMAVLAARPAATNAAAMPASTKVTEVAALKETLPRWAIPRIAFTTSEETRRPMALNGMRMSLEYFETGSPRVLQLIVNRLEAGQRDVVHDVLVYLMQQALDVRAHATEARDLRAESVAAYLGLQQSRVRLLLDAERLSTTSISRAVEADFAGPVCRAINVHALIEGQLNLLKPQLRRFNSEEQNVLQIVDRIVAHLHQDATVVGDAPLHEVSP